MKAIESYLPLFQGFYNTTLEYYEEEHDIDHYNEKNGTELTYDDFNWDYQEREKRVSPELCEKISKLLKYEGFEIDIKFQKLISPREYNFSNDSINCEFILNQSTYDKIIDYLKVNWSSFEQYIKSEYTSYDDFISSHSNSAEVWMNNMKSESHLEHNFGSVLHFIMNNEGYYHYDLKIDSDYVNYEVID